MRKNCPHSPPRNDTRIKLKGFNYLFTALFFVVIGLTTGLVLGSRNLALILSVLMAVVFAAMFQVNKDDIPPPKL